MKILSPRTTGSPLNSVKTTAPLAALLLCATIALGHGSHRAGETRNRLPHIPAGLEVPAGNEHSAHATGVGVQIYVWTINPANPALASWVFKAPHAVLFAGHEDEREDLTGIHFAGPNWQANDGSKVAGAKVAAVTVNSNAIPWLLLKATSTSAAGTFSGITFIHRLNTLGGLAPTAPGQTAGEELLVPYIADYYFYHAKE